MGNCVRAIFKNPIFYIVLIALICLSIQAGINLGISYGYLFLIENYLYSFPYLKYGLILILLIWNYLNLRLTVMRWLFEWQFPLQIFSIYKERQNYISYLKARVLGVINMIDVLLDEQYKLTDNEITETEYFLELFDDEFYIYDNLYNIVYTGNGINNNGLIKYKMSKCQVRYYNLLKIIDNILKENELRNKLKNLRNKENNLEHSIKNEKNEKDIESLNNLKLRMNEFLAIIEKYSWENYTYLSPAYIYNLFFNDTFGSLSLYSLQFKKNFQEYTTEENYSSNGKIHYTLIRSNNKDNKNNIIYNQNEVEAEEKLLIDKENEIKDDGALLFFCLPNGGCYELIPKQKIEFYLIHGFSFLCWNYRGYGFSKGRTSFFNCKKDALDIFDTITKNEKYNFKKICLMGHSIGGVAMSYISKNRKVDMVISDRNFCDIPRIAKNLHCGSILNFLVKTLLIGKTNIIEDIMDENNINNSDKINRIVIYSPTDSLILNDCTVKSGISRYIIKKYIIYRNLENNSTIKSKENFLDIVFNSTEKNLFLESLIELIHINHDKALENRINSEIFKEEGEIKTHEKNNDVSYLFFDKFYGLCSDNLSYISEHNISIRRQKIFLDSFFNNLLIWGAQGEDIYPNEEIYEFYSNKGFKIIKDAYEVLKKANYDENIINDNILERKILLMQRIKIYFEKILFVMKNLDIDTSILNNKRESLRFSNLNNSNFKAKLIENEDEEETEIKTDNTNEKKISLEIENNNIFDNDKNSENIFVVNNFYKKLKDIIGNFRLFKTYAGHNGPLKMDEKEQFFCFLLSSGIID